MRRLWFTAVFLLIGCGPSGAPVREEVKSVASRPAVPARPDKSGEGAGTGAPTGPVTPDALPGTTTSDAAAADFRESEAVTAFEVRAVAPAELAEARKPIDALAARIETFLPGFARQLRWVLGRPVEVYRGSWTALLREGPFKFMARADQLSFAADVLHHEGGLIFAAETWAAEAADARTLRLLTAALDHLLQFESYEKAYCLSYRENAADCASAWEAEQRPPKNTKFAALKTVAQALLSGNEAFMSTAVVMGLLKPFGFQAPYLTHAVYNGEHVLAALRRFDGRALTPVAVTGDRAADYGARTACRLRVTPTALQVELAGTPEVRLELAWTLKNDEQIESYTEAGAPLVYRFYAAGPGHYAEVSFAAGSDQLTLKLNELTPAPSGGTTATAPLATTLVCGESAKEAP